MSELSTKEDHHSLKTVPERELSSPLQPTRRETAPVIFKDSFGPMGKDGQRASIAVSNSSNDSHRPTGALRRPSLIQFNTAPAEDTIRRESVAAGKLQSMEARKMSVGERRTSEGGRRMSSPPPKSTYQRGVSFDTFDNRDATDFSLTLNYKHRNHQSTRRSRTFLCGTDQNDYSEFALEWLLDELVDDGDEIVCLRVVERDSKLASDTSVQQGRYRQEAQKLMDWVILKNSQEGERAISLVLELAVGKVQDVIQRMIQIYEPAVLVVGTRGRNLGGMQGLLPGSVSKYCLQQSPIPVIVVRPSTKRLKKKKKRMADPARRNYNSILEKARAGYSLDKTARNSIIGSLPSATDQEAAAVAEAIGVPKNFEATPLSRVVSSKTDASERSASPRPVSPASSNVVMKSPNLSPVDSPEVSDGDSDDASWTRSPKVRRRAGKARGATDDEVDPSRDPPWLAAILASDTRKV
ncbi:hypothetical protein GJ744_004286 [Endocarpon pusillum]|uniref:UspA domain-containing protein n=1 Tax=Endocarpon pusillum TaxID=364733 RepID=A0A8H7A842_9EURO|nr:hypothetical protein GJ744_004286 [Endocarpon pusillum]